MSFYLVPSVLYQTKQKLKKAGERKHKQKSKKKDKKTASLVDSASGLIYESEFADESISGIGSDVDMAGSKSTPGSEKDNPFTNYVSNDHVGSLITSNSSNSLSSNIASLYLADSPSSHLQDSYSDSKLSPTTDDRQNARRASISSNFSLSNNNVKPNDSLSTLNTNINKQRSQSDLSDNSENRVKNSEIFKPQYSMAQTETFPEFKTLRDLSKLNDSGSLQNILYTPSFQTFRYERFLDIMSTQHKNDPINFGNIRYSSMTRFISRHNAFNGVDIENAIKGSNIKDFEGVLSYNLVHLRSFMRTLIRVDSSAESKNGVMYSCEELVQVNFTNYLRFILNLLPRILSTPSEQLNKYQIVHKKFKAIFTCMTQTLHTFQQRETGDELSHTSDSESYLLQLVNKLSYEYILLEKYHINILAKFSGNSLISYQILAKLFKTYRDSLTDYKKNNRYILPKVLVYSAYFSAQYSWNLAVANPFVRVLESNVFVENPKYLNDLAEYKKMEKGTDKTSFQASDDSLYVNYFQRLNLESFNGFRRMSDMMLVNLQKSLNEVGESNHRPPNFEFYGQSLSTIPNETFDTIQSRDLFLQLTNSNYRSVLTEFYRILKVGGTLEIPIVLSGSNTIRSDKSIVGFPEFTKTVGAELTGYYDLVPNLAEVLISTIISLFGEGNVRLSVVLLDSSNDLTRFLIRDIGLHVAEFIGKIDNFCKQFGAEELNSSQDTHFFFPIHATKVL